MNFDKIKLKCQCGGTMQKMITSWKGIEVRGWKCPKCKEELINPVDSQRALEIAKAKKENLLKVKLRKVGRSEVVTVPKILVEKLNLRDGAILEWKVKDSKLVLE